MITQIDHIGIAVKSHDAHVPFYRDVLGFEFLGFEKVAEQKVKVAMLKVGEVKIELLQPISEGSPIAKFIEKRGEGIHHIAYRTDGISGQISDLKKNGIQMIDEIPKIGAHETQIAFIHPKSSGRVLTELCQMKGAHNE
ncbi:MAG: methylmalonyl-CoA epimerase [Calditrichaeota bacterium]|nr:MAG: methylmalonyl-CoA epimerase [Calditrichota bacterium]